MDNNPPYWMYLYDYILEWLLIHVKKKLIKFVISLTFQHHCTLHRILGKMRTVLKSLNFI